MTDLIRPIVDRLEDALNGLSGNVTLRWGTVTAITPLAVRLDADDSPLPFPPICPILGLKVGDRVLCATQNRRVTVVTATGMTKTAAATQAEVDAGVEPTKFVTPKTLRSRALVATGALTPGTGWTVYAPHANRVVRDDTGRCNLQVSLLAGTGAALGNLGAIPAAFRPAQEMPVGTVVTTTGLYGNVYLGTDGKITVPYAFGTSGVGTYYPMNLSWQL